jgi:hypothetical protein
MLLLLQLSHVAPTRLSPAFWNHDEGMVPRLFVPHPHPPLNNLELSG